MNLISYEFIKVSYNLGLIRIICLCYLCYYMGTEGIEPPSSALEADILPVYDAPLLFLKKVYF